MSLDVDLWFNSIANAASVKQMTLSGKCVWNNDIDFAHYQIEKTKWGNLPLTIDLFIRVDNCSPLAYRWHSRYVSKCMWKLHCQLKIHLLRISCKLDKREQIYIYKMRSETVAAVGS
jgi:hypothetical protein